MHGLSQTCTSVTRDMYTFVEKHFQLCTSLFIHCLKALLRDWTFACALRKVLSIKRSTRIPLLKCKHKVKTKHQVVAMLTFTSFLFLQQVIIIFFIYSFNILYVFIIYVTSRRVFFIYIVSILYIFIILLSLYHRHHHHHHQHY